MKGAVDARIGACHLQALALEVQVLDYARTMTESSSSRGAESAM